MGEHDSIFKRAFSVPAHAAGELRSVLPAALVERLDLSTLELLPSSYVDPEMAHRHVDLLFRVQVDRRDAYVYFLLEHQSAPDPLMPWRILVYMQRVWSAVLRREPGRRALPPIVPIVVHHGASGWDAPREFHEVVEGLAEMPSMRPFVPNFDLVIDDLVTVDDQDLQRRPLAPFPKVALWLLRDGRSLDVFLEHLGAWAAELERVVREDRGREDTSVLVRYILRVSGETPFDIVQEQIAKLAPALEEPMASAAEQLIQRGIEKGIEKGIERGFERGIEKGIEKGIETGRLDALQTVLSRQLSARFGALDDAARARLAAATSTDLERWLERVLHAATLEDVFAP